MGSGRVGKNISVAEDWCYVKIDVMSCTHWLELGEVFSGGRGGSY